MKTEKREHKLPVRVSAEELDAIKKRAQQTGLTVSEFVRRAALYSRVVIKESRHDVELVRQLSAIGNNLNQLVRKSHASGRMDTRRLEDLLSVIEQQLLRLINGSED